MLEWTKKMYDKAGPKVAEAIRRRRMEAYYCSTAEEAAAKVLELIPMEDSVSWGGTMTVNQLGIKELLAKRGQKLIDRDSAKTPEEREEIMRQSLFCGTFLMSANAISETGELVNIDGAANRVAALCYGPRSVVVVAGMNKVAPTLDAALSRARHIAAPMNAQRFDGKTPCSVTGQCADCVSPDCICNQIVITRGTRPAGRIKVVLVGEDLGF